MLLVEPAGDRMKPRGGTAGASSGVRDLDRAARAAAEMIEALGIELDDEGVARTPHRLVGALAEILTPEPFAFTTFANDAEHSGLVLARSIPVRALCEHHLLPFVGVAHVGYVPGVRISGLSKLARLVQDSCSTRPQVQERITQDVADRLEAVLDPQGVAVVIEAEHLCMTVRGVRAPGADTYTSTYRGVLADDPRLHDEFVRAVTHVS